jgi:hypothetical protein
MLKNRKGCSFCSSQEQNPDTENGFIREEISENLSVNCHVLDALFAGFMIRMLLWHSAIFTPIKLLPKGFSGWVS